MGRGPSAIVGLAAATFQAAEAILAIKHADGCRVIASAGLEPSEVSRDAAPIVHVLESGETLVVADLSADPRFARTPFVLAQGKRRFFASVALKDAAGTVVGCLAVTDATPREPTASVTATLELLAVLCLDQLSLKQNEDAAADLLEQLRESEAHTRAIIDTAVDAIVATNAHGLVERVNPAVEKLFGYPSEELIGKNISILMAPIEQAQHDGYIKNYRETGHTKIIGIGRETFGKKKSGEIFPIDLSVGEAKLASRRFFIGIIRDISARKAADRLLREKTEELDRFFSMTLDLLCIFDAGGVFRRVNPEWEVALGWPSDELAGKSLLDLLHPEDLAATSVILGRLAAKERVLGFETRCRDRSGAYRFLEWRAFPSGDAIYASARDITERKKLDRMKSEFVSTVSHELRTPLTSIRGSLGLLAGGLAGALPSEAREMVDIALNNSDRLVRLINDILDIEKIESGGMDFKLEPVSLTELVQRAIDAHQGFAATHRTRFVLSDSLPAGEVLVDGDRLTQVLTNLLSNAAKFSPAEQPVDVSVTRTATRFRVSVRDRGPGIPEEFRARMFQRFAQADASDTKLKGGTGLGLSISRAIIDQLHGTIDYAPMLDGGTAFYFELPALAGIDEPGATERPTAQRVLVCEDDPETGQLL
jgi:PAS domain S-box-containing protein